MNVQRQVVYAQRRRVLEGEDLSDEVLTWIDEVVENVVAAHTEAEFAEEWDLDALVARHGRALRDARSRSTSCARRSSSTARRSIAEFQEDARDEYAAKVEEIGANPETGEPLMRDVERFLILQIVDRRWREHLENMDYLRDGIHLRAMAQKDPLTEYRAEGHAMFQELNAAIREEVVLNLFHAQIEPTGRGVELAAAARRPNGGGNGELSLRARVRRGRRRDRGRGRRRPRRPAVDGASRRRSAAAAPRSRRSSGSRPSTRRSAATTRAGAARARSSRSATAPSGRRIALAASLPSAPRLPEGEAMSANPQLHRLEGISPKAYEHPADRAATAALQSIPMLDTGRSQADRVRLRARAAPALPRRAPSRSGRTSCRTCGRVLRARCSRRSTCRRSTTSTSTQFPFANAAAIGAGKPMIVLNSAHVDAAGRGRAADRARPTSSGHILSDHVLYRTALMILPAARATVAPAVPRRAAAAARSRSRCSSGRARRS